MFKTKKTFIVPKKCLEDMINKYRPISVITAFTIIFEKTLKCGNEQFIKKIVCKYGFQERLCTNYVISTSLQKCYAAVDETKPSFCVFLNLAEVFDTVSHLSLLEAL